MRKSLISLLTFLVLAGITTLTEAQNCPRGAKDCRGLCGWYYDNNHDGFCDITGWSDALLLKNKRCNDSIAAVAKAAAEKKCHDSIAKATLNSEGNEGEVKYAADLKESNKASLTERDISTPPSAQKKVEGSSIPVISNAPVVKGPIAPSKSKYDLILILSGCTLLYIFTFLLARRDVIKKATHRKIWNTVLLLTFLATGLIGLFLTIQLNYALKIEWFASLLYWHVEFGIAMATISIFHILWHLKYWLNLLSQPGRSRIKDA